MTENEAIEYIKNMAFMCGEYEKCQYGHQCTTKCLKATGIAIQALEEIQQHRTIGTIEEFKVLKEKSVAKKPYIQQIVKDFREHDCYECPNCDCFVGYVSECQEEHYQYIYCPNCGQKLDWQ